MVGVVADFIKLISASQEGKLDTVKTLIDLGADINATDSIGRSAMHYAIAYRNLEIAKYLGSKRQISRFSSLLAIRGCKKRRIKHSKNPN